MNQSADEIYENISKLVFKGTDGLFSNAILEVELHSLAMKLSGGYYSTHSNKTLPFSFLKEHKKELLKELRKLQNLMPNEPWNMLTYTLDASGGHYADFQWSESLALDIEEVCAVL